MAGSVNKVVLIGNLGRDPESRDTAESRIVNLTVATSETWNDKASGERKEKTEWHRVVIFNDRICEVAEKYLRKGSKVYIEGALQTRKWTDKTGVERFATELVIGRFKGELVMLGTPAEGRPEPSPPEPVPEPAPEPREPIVQPPSRRREAAAPGAYAMADDEIPFAACWQ